MKLLIKHCDNCQNPIRLDIIVANRNGLRQRFGGDFIKVRCGTCAHERIYSIRRVEAVKDSNNTGTGAVVGGLIGLLGGPLGVLIGGGLGAALGGANDTEETRKINNFNNSW